MMNGITREEYRNGFLDSMYIEYKGDNPEAADEYRVLDDDLNCIKTFNEYEKAEDYVYRKGYRC